MHSLFSLGVFLFLVIIAVIAGGQFTGGDWYQSVQQGAWAPPAWLLAPVWAVIYVLMAVSAWMVWETRRALAIAALAVWALQLFLIVGWSWTYFGLHRTGWALGVMSLWLVVAMLVFLGFRAIRPETARLTLPIGAWVLFCWLLNLTQWFISGGGLDTILH